MSFRQLCCGSFLGLFGGRKQEITASKKLPKLDESSGSETEIGETLQDVAERISQEFDFSGEALNRAVKAFVQQLNDGLQKPGSTIEQLPSFITELPTGLEKGTFLAVDLGGTNIRVCSITLNGDGTHSMLQAKAVIPSELMAGETSKGLFGFVAKSVESFLEVNFPESLNHRKEPPPMFANVFNLGFTFSHAVDQLDIDSGTLIRWSKGFDINGVVGQDICVLLQNEFDEILLPVRATALLNDTVGTLMARAYVSSSSARTVIGAVFGTGTNGAYVEKRSNITKLSSPKKNLAREENMMIVNTEWGNFDQKLEFLPSTTFDMAIDLGSVNPGFEMFEKRISGMYLGEILRLVILSLVKGVSASIFSTTSIPASSHLFQQWGLDSELMSILEADSSQCLAESRLEIEKWMGISNPSYEDAKAMKTISHAIGRRSARLSAVALGAVVIQTDCLRDYKLSGSRVDIGVDGSLIERYPGFVEEIREAFINIDDIGIEGEGKIDIAIAKDGSSLGAALSAHVAATALEARQR